MKLITFAVPCYNSENYMCQCIDSLLTGGEDVEIIIVNDGCRTVRQELRTNMRNSTLLLSERYIKRTADTVRESIKEWKPLRGYIIK